MSMADLEPDAVRDWPGGEGLYPYWKIVGPRIDLRSLPDFSVHVCWSA